VECSGYFGFNCKINKKYLLDKRKFDGIIYLCVVKLYCFTRGQCGRLRPETTDTSHTDPKQGRQQSRLPKRPPECRRACADPVY
jgi:hypothetical protein